MMHSYFFLDHLFEIWLWTRTERATASDTNWFLAHVEIDYTQYGK